MMKGVELKEKEKEKERRVFISLQGNRRRRRRRELCSRAALLVVYWSTEELTWPARLENGPSPSHEPCTQLTIVSPLKIRELLFLSFSAADAAPPRRYSPNNNNSSLSLL